MNRMDVTMGLITLLGVILVASLTFYFLKEPDMEIAQIPETMKSSHLTSKRMEGRKGGGSSKPIVGNPIPKNGLQKVGLIHTNVSNGGPPNPSANHDVHPLKEFSGTHPSFPNKKTEESMPSLGDIQFDFDRRGLPEEAKTLLRQIAEQLIDSPWSVLLQGHTDSRGSIPHNLRLGLRRAETVKTYLVDLGVPANHIYVTSLGEFEPVCLPKGEECRRKNRRVHFSLAKIDLPDNQPAGPIVWSDPSQQSHQSNTTIEEGLATDEMRSLSVNQEETHSSQEDLLKTPGSRNLAAALQEIGNGQTEEGKHAHEPENPKGDLNSGNTNKGQQSELSRTSTHRTPNKEITQPGSLQFYPVRR